MGSKNSKRKNNKRKNAEKKNTPQNVKPKWTAWAAGIAKLVALAAALANLVQFGLVLYREHHPAYAYEAKYDWLTMNAAETVLSNQSVIKVFTYDDGTYDIGAVLIALYNNLCDQERIISHFTVYAEDIVEDYTPVLRSYFGSEIELITCTMTNIGWGKTNEIQIALSDIFPASGSEEQTAVELSLREGTNTSWSFESIAPGESRSFCLLSQDDFIVNCKEPFEETVEYYLQFTVDAPSSNYHSVIECALDVYPDKLVVVPSGGIGGSSDTEYVVFVDTSESTWTHTYDTFQCLPAKQAIRIPMFIMPAKSCTMSIRIEFETIDGEIIEATPLKDAKFVVPYYINDPVTYIDGLLLDRGHLSGNVQIYFPFRYISKVVPPEVAPGITDD